jgi:hypothetical protein
MTKEGCLIKNGDHYLHPEVLSAMDEWAKAFADWIRVEGWNNRNGYDWCRYETIYSDISVKTTEELYQLYIKLPK